jgi:hypothetical protein
MTQKKEFSFSKRVALHEIIICGFSKYCVFFSMVHALVIFKTARINASLCEGVNMHKVKMYIIMTKMK